MLVGRGSTDPDACAEMVKFARLLGDGRGLGLVEAAFVAMTRPSVAEALERCRRLGARRVAVVPLFLFPGVLVDRIGEQAAAWAADHPRRRRWPSATRSGPHPRLADLVVERFGEPQTGDVRMNCDVCSYRVRLPGFEERVGTPLSLAPPDARAPDPGVAGPPGGQPGRGRGGRAARAARAAGSAAGAASAAGADGGAARRSRCGAWSTAGPTAPTGSPASTSRSSVGERVAVLGANGSGKTTLALHLVGALERERGLGAGRRAGRSCASTSPRCAGGWAWSSRTPTTSCCCPTVAADVALAPGNHGLAADEVDARVAAALDVVGPRPTSAERAPEHLSLGERRRVALAGVLAAHPEILVLDEPTANLDPAARRDLIEVIRGLELTTLVITHDLPLALELCPRSVVRRPRPGRRRRADADAVRQPVAAGRPPPRAAVPHGGPAPGRLTTPTDPVSHAELPAVGWRPISRGNPRWSAMGRR